MTAKRLIKTWDERDRLYAGRRIHGVRAALTLREQESIRWWRMREAAALSEDHQIEALAVLDRWTPPMVAAA